ncbi:uncharacterized protein LOC127378594 isoform X2 [Dicentrarchus labrax]|uniref:uncharacterized protein LOC127378594 isoform X2 n=1 Tax=Dicentrarchus labrax TaxID=13489 RepID=UPI0021F66BB8|nr:uncharacterized protein LOC127378594 isoform X2 [Dicentrarchus labrax]
MQQSLFEQHFTQAKLGKAPIVFKLQAANGLEIPYTSYAVLDLELEGAKIPGRGIVIVKDEHCTHPLIIGMNVVTACWTVFFKCPRGSVPPPQTLQRQRVWRDAFATCRHIEATMTEDGMLGYVRPASRRVIKIPPKNRYQKLGKLSRVDEADVHGACDLNLSLEGDCVVGVTLVNAAVDEEDQKLPIGVSELSNRPDLSEQQQEELRALLLKWQKVFAQHNEDFGRTDLVQHRIHTGDAPPIRERHRPLPPAMYKEMKSLLSGLKKP